MKPGIRFNGFSDEWVEKKLGDVFKKGGSGGTPSSSKSEYYDGGIPFLSISDLSKSDVYVNETLKSITELGLNNSAAWIVPKNAISLAMYASVGKVGILSKPMATSQAFYNMVFDSIETGMFVYQWLTNRYIMNGWRKDISTGTQPNLNAQIVKSTVIQLPTLPEQQKIGGLFSKYDAIIALCEEKLAELDALKKGLLQQMFPKNGAKVPELRFAGFADDWEEKKLGELANFSKGKGYTKNDLIESGDPIVMYGRLYTKYEIVIENVDTFVKKKDNSIISEGYEVVVPASGETSEDISRASAVIVSGLILGGDLNVIKPLHDIDSIFLALTISNGSQQKELSKRAQGKSIVHLHNADLKQVNLLYPKFEEQQKIGQLFKQLDARISNEQTMIEQLKTQKQGLLQRMLTNC